jgi:hypothetical protein
LEAGGEREQRLTVPYCSKEKGQYSSTMTRPQEQTYLLLIRSLETLPRQLPLLPNRYEPSSQPQRERRTKEETARVESDKGVDLGVGVAGFFAETGEDDRGDVVEEGGEEGLCGSSDRRGRGKRGEEMAVDGEGWGQLGSTRVQEGESGPRK